MYGRRCATSGGFCEPLGYVDGDGGADVGDAFEAAVGYVSHPPTIQVWTRLWRDMPPEDHHLADIRRSGLRPHPQS